MSNRYETLVEIMPNAAFKDVKSFLEGDFEGTDIITIHPKSHSKGINHMYGCPEIQI